MSLAIMLSVPITVVTHRDKANPFRRSSILFRPHIPPTTGDLVEPPGTAPGSDPLITSAFMSIVPKDSLDIAPSVLDLKTSVVAIVQPVPASRGQSCQMLRPIRATPTAISHAKKPHFFCVAPSSTIDVSRPIAAKPQAKPIIA